MKNVVSMIVVVAVATYVSATAAAGVTYIVGTPGTMDAETANVVLSSVVKLLDKGAAGDEVRVYDAWSGQLMGGFTIPNTSSPRARRLRTKVQMGVIVSKLKRASSVRSGQEGEVRLPHFLQLVSSGLRTGAGDVRVLVFGGPYYTDSRDKGFTFGNGLYPSDGHILAEQSKSVFGTAGRKDLLSGCVVHFCYFDDERFKGDLRSLEISAIRRFWHLYFLEMGGILSSFSPSADEVTRNAMAGMKDAVLPDRVDQADTAVEMRRVGETQAAPNTAAATELSPAASAPHLLIHIDGTASMGAALDAIVSMLKTAVTTGASLCGEVKVGIIVYRGPGETDVLPLTVVRRPGAGGADQGMTSFLNFLEGKDVPIPDGDAKSGSRMVSRMHPRTGRADVASAIRTGLSLLRGSAAKDAPLLVVYCGDQGPFELNDSTVIDADERRTVEALHQEMRSFASAYQKTEVLSIFTGRNQVNAAESDRFYRGLAQAAGGRGTFVESPSSLLAKALDLFQARR